MEGTHLPIQYRVEIYESSFINDASATFEASTPFMAIHVGDYIDHRIWLDAGSVSSEIDKQQALRVKAINHLIWKIDGSHIGHSLSVLVEVVPSPV
jgi:hypothetical protein